jgi:hypothetical protein
MKRRPTINVGMILAWTIGCSGGGGGPVLSSLGGSVGSQSGGTKGVVGVLPSGSNVLAGTVDPDVAF